MTPHALGLPKWEVLPCLTPRYLSQPCSAKLMEAGMTQGKFRKFQAVPYYVYHKLHLHANSPYRRHPRLSQVRPRHTMQSSASADLHDNAPVAAVVAAARHARARHRTHQRLQLPGAVQVAVALQHHRALLAVHRPRGRRQALRRVLVSMTLSMGVTTTLVLQHVCCPLRVHSLSCRWRAPRARIWVMAGVWIACPAARNQRRLNAVEWHMPWHIVVPGRVGWRWVWLGLCRGAGARRACARTPKLPSACLFGTQQSSVNSLLTIESLRLCRCGGAAGCRAGVLMGACCAVVMQRAVSKLAARASCMRACLAIAGSSRQGCVHACEGRRRLAAGASCCARLQFRADAGPPAPDTPCDSDSAYSGKEPAEVCYTCPNARVPP